MVSLELVGANASQRMFQALHVVDYASVFLALSDGIDPNPVAMVEVFKSSLDSDYDPMAR